MLYFGEVAIRLEMLNQFNKALHQLDIVCPCRIPIKYDAIPDDDSSDSDGEGWTGTKDDPAVASKFY